jgi:chemotaxis protein CheD
VTLSDGEGMIDSGVRDGLPTEAPRRRGAFLQPGQVAAFAHPAALTTILGSCVSVCLWDARRGQGGMNHFLLPDWAGELDSSARYGDVAVEQLLGKLAALGSPAKDLQAKLFGGACVLEPFRERKRHLGLQNVDAAKRILAEARIEIVAEDTGGDRGRKLVFNTDDGSAFVRRL